MSPIQKYRGHFIILIYLTDYALPIKKTSKITEKECHKLMRILLQIPNCFFVEPKAVEYFVPDLITIYYLLIGLVFW